MDSEPEITCEIGTESVDGICQVVMDKEFEAKGDDRYQIKRTKTKLL